MLAQPYLNYISAETGVSRMPALLSHEFCHEPTVNRAQVGLPDNWLAKLPSYRHHVMFCADNTCLPTTPHDADNQVSWQPQCQSLNPLKSAKVLYSSNLFSQLFSVNIRYDSSLDPPFHSCLAMQVRSLRIPLNSRVWSVCAMLTDLVDSEKFLFPRCVRNL